MEIETHSLLSIVRMFLFTCLKLDIVFVRTNEKKCEKQHQNGEMTNTQTITLIHCCFRCGILSLFSYETN